ncbi:DUF5789 family protein [Candidatus Halobonum tyrrellensis]|uniref:Uncharacterized protein n=1 Tax=Candidatus Halobonum tyrrellensis G22 TaxID=1324957 RepID=V4HGS0_9EURY|nr:DUF5789 family protein [Candidatus Halobonum tyrrellensis]ESP89890.1 hypothetical protein K933_01672 [Candidatus Halobonum tyrrellensis G22]
MADDESEEEAEEEPAVELGEGPAVEGAPLARVASRLTWPQEKSRVLAKEGDATIRTPEGPRHLDAVLDEVDETYFDTRQSFTEAVEGVVGTGPVKTAE